MTPKDSLMNSDRLSFLLAESARIAAESRELVRTAQEVCQRLRRQLSTEWEGQQMRLLFLAERRRQLREWAGR